jgi:tetratricopeptide (TPR) repeat protein
MADKTQDPQADAGKAWPFVMTWTGRATALLGLFASLAGGVTWLVSHHRQVAERNVKMALAQAQVQQKDYSSAVASYGEILKASPSYPPALDAQLRAAELWTENFHVVAREDQDEAQVAGASLDQLMPVLEAGLARSKGTEAADVQAHIGWAHWLNQWVAGREDGPAAKQNLRAALAADPTNVYANAMLGNWMLHNRGNFAEAAHHFDVAVATGKVRPWVRTMQLDGLAYRGDKDQSPALVRVVNDMRKAGEPLGGLYRRRVLNLCFSSSILEHDVLVGALSAVPPDEEWKTYLWLNENSEYAGDQRTDEFIQANLLEVSGDRAGALEKYRQLSHEIKNSSSPLTEQVNAAVARLSSR